MTGFDCAVCLNQKVFQVLQSSKACQKPSVVYMYIECSCLGWTISRVEGSHHDGMISGCFVGRERRIEESVSVYPPSF